ncbi:hypothetical protein [Allopontixanthobacter sediminis]|uniref:Helix-turn-helix domain-containing protein n=1 Tax=Allopontixanthobacter sediminis TaxID=1689985 RepID=A0A845AVA1_9SPHN|nr:hypothetical protein [Allopontixanthobacter sediminis]MXP42961.1 hypothetical protein [Allopontixanthobacter sediminis]
MKTINDFSTSEKAVIRERRKHQGNVELARVFGCDARTIAAIGRGS